MFQYRASVQGHKPVASFDQTLDAMEREGSMLKVWHPLSRYALACNGTYCSSFHTAASFRLLLAFQPFRLSHSSPQCWVPVLCLLCVQSIFQKMQSAVFGVKVKDRRKGFRKIRRCFSGYDMVPCLPTYFAA